MFCSSCQVTYLLTYLLKYQHRGLLSRPRWQPGPAATQTPPKKKKERNGPQQEGGGGLGRGGAKSGAWRWRAPQTGATPPQPFPHHPATGREREREREGNRNRPSKPRKPHCPTEDFRQNPKKYYELLGKYYRMASKSYIFPGFFSSVHKCPTNSWDFFIKIHQNTRNSWENLTGNTKNPGASWEISQVPINFPQIPGIFCAISKKTNHQNPPKYQEFLRKSYRTY